jgi:hypothetical protein
MKPATMHFDVRTIFGMRQTLIARNYDDVVLSRFEEVKIKTCIYIYIYINTEDVFLLSFVTSYMIEMGSLILP